MKTGGASGKTVITVPGLTGPFSSSHRPVYDFLKREAQARGYNDTVAAVLPGQAVEEGTRSGYLNFPDAVTNVRQLLSERLNGSTEVRLCGVSFGCGVAVSAASGQELEPHKDRISIRLWAPIPLWQSWSAFSRGPKSEQLGRETVFGDHREFYSGLEPLEVTLPHLQFRTKVCMGDRDEYNPPVWLDYLRALCARTGATGAVQVLYPLPECHHNVTPQKSEGFPAYLDFMLN